MKKIIIAANRGQIRILKYRAAGEDPIEQEHLVEEPQVCLLQAMEKRFL